MARRRAQRNMAAKFHERFDIQIDAEEARRRFVNRIHNEIFCGFLEGLLLDLDAQSWIVAYIFTILGEGLPSNYGVNSLLSLVGSNYLRNLKALEVLHEILTDEGRGYLNQIVQDLLDLSEIDLGIRWSDGRFLLEGARLLDDKLVNDSLQFLRGKGLETVLMPFEKSLGHLLSARKESSRFHDAVTDAYEALEAMAKIRAGNNRDISANRELFISRINASDNYKRLLVDYVDYGCRFRHAASPDTPKPSITYREAESFIYLTGIFIRLAMPED